MKYLIIIAVEEYQDAKLPPLAWAMNDADAVIAAFDALGYAGSEHHIYRNDQATKTRIESQIRRLLPKLTGDDELSLYFVGQGFSFDEHTVLAAWDTQHDDIEETSIQLDGLLRQLLAAACRKIAIFFDVSHDGEADISERALGALPKADGKSVVFTACGPAEISHRSGTLKRGVWSYHLTEALAGRAQAALQRGRMLTTTSLQTYLATHVPTMVAEGFTDGRSQNPEKFGADFTLADLAGASSSRAEPVAEARPLPRATFRGETSLSVKRLSGYQPQFKVPKAVDKWSQKWVQTAGAKDVETEIDEAYATIRDAMNYKRRELKKGYDGGASGTIITPDFDYNISLHQDPQTPGDALIRREVTHIRNPAAVLSDVFQKAFPGLFDTIAFSTIADVDVAAIIDRLEDVEPEGIELLNYDDGCTYCKIRVDGIDGIMTITRSDIQIVSTSHKPPRELAQMFVKSWNALLPSTPDGMLLLPGETGE